jgi:hypothetical protein
MSFQASLDSYYAEAVTLLSTKEITELPNELTSQILTKFKANEEFVDYKLAVNITIASKDIKGDVKSVSAGLYNNKTDGTITIRREFREEYIIIITLFYIKV